VSAVVANGHDLTALFVVLALVAFGGAAWLAYRREIVGAIVLAFIAALILIFGT
jgi:hypothetical protein